MEEEGFVLQILNILILLFNLLLNLLDNLLEIGDGGLVVVLVLISIRQLKFLFKIRFFKVLDLLVQLLHFLSILFNLIIKFVYPFLF